MATKKSFSKPNDEHVQPPELQIFFMNTTKLEKIEQLNAQAKNRGYSALFLPVSSLGKPAHSPDEITGAFEGNKNTKLETCAAHLAEFDYEKNVVPALASLGISREALAQGKIKLYGCAEDSGFAFDRGSVQKTNEFADMFFNTGANGPYTQQADKELVESLKRFCAYDNKGRRKPFPGVETVRVMGAAGGVDNFFRLMELTMEKMGVPINPPPRSANRLNFIDESILGAFEWDPTKPVIKVIESGKDKKRVIATASYSGQGISNSTYYKNRDASGEVLSYTHTIPSGMYSRGSRMSREELGPLYQPKARGNALGVLYKDILARNDWDKKKPKEKESWVARVHNAHITPEVQERRDDYTVAVLPTDGDYSHSAFASRVVDAVHKKGWNAELPKDEKNQRSRIWHSVGGFQHMLDTSDAVLFLPHGEDKQKPAGQDNSRMLEQIHAVAQFLEHVTLYPEGKPKLGVFVEQQPGDYEKFIAPFVTLFNKGVFGDRPMKLIKKASSVDEGMKLLAEHQKQYLPPLVEPEQDTPVPVHKHMTGKYNVCVFLSASMEGIFEDKAYALGERLHSAGMGLVYGAADRHAMGAVFKGACDAAKDKKQKAKVLGSTTHVIAATECEHGTKPKDLPGEMFYLAPNIPKRKEYLFKNSDAFVVLEGGVGTYDELLQYIYYKNSLKESERELVKNKPMIICESAYANGSMYKKALNDYLGDGDPTFDVDKLTQKERLSLLDKKGMYVVKPATELSPHSNKKLYDYDLDEAMKILKKDREKRWVSEIKPENLKYARQERAQPPTR